MIEAERISEVPSVPGVYAMYGGDTQRYVAYVGTGEKVKVRLTQHLIRRDSSVVTGASAVSLNPDLVREVAWWTHELFYESKTPYKANQTTLRAAELILSSKLDPVLRSRGAVSQEPRDLAADETFRAEMEELFSGPPSGRLYLRHTVERLDDLEQRIEALEKRLSAAPADDPS